MMFDMKSTRALASVIGPRRGRNPTIISRADAESDRRFSGRRSSEARAFIFATTLSEPYPCTIRDQSATGARVTIALDRTDMVAGVDDLPDKFTIVIQRDRVSLDCTVAWRHAQSMGLRFTSPARLLPKTTVSPPKTARNIPVKARR